MTIDHVALQYMACMVNINNITVIMVPVMAMSTVVVVIIVIMVVLMMMVAVVTMHLEANKRGITIHGSKIDL
jgi:uncharacterized membrane protein SpoIIM required for sporulation